MRKNGLLIYIGWFENMNKWIKINENKKKNLSSR